jgi:hypothetical protein
MHTRSINTCTFPLHDLQAYREHNNNRAIHLVPVECMRYELQVSCISRSVHQVVYDCVYINLLSEVVTYRAKMFFNFVRILYTTLHLS